MFHWLELTCEIAVQNTDCRGKKPWKKIITCIKIETKHPPNFEFPQYPQGRITSYRNSMLHFNHAFNRKTCLQLPPLRGQGAYCLLVWGHSWCNQPLKINSNQKHKLHYPNTGIGSSSFDTSILYNKPGNISSQYHTQKRKTDLNSNAWLKKKFHLKKYQIPYIVILHYPCYVRCTLLT